MANSPFHGVDRRSPVTRTDAILKKVAEELERSRPWLDHMTGVRSVVIDIKMVDKTIVPRVVIIRTESESN